MDDVTNILTIRLVNQFTANKSFYLFIYLLSMDYFDYFFKISLDERNLYDVKWIQISARTDVAFKAQTIIVFIWTFSRYRLDGLFFSL